MAELLCVVCKENKAGGDGLCVKCRFKMNTQQESAPLEEQELLLPEGRYFGKTRNGIPNGRGELTYNEGDSRKYYRGEFKDGMRHGKGKLVFRNDAYYDGEWVHDKYDGYGSYWTCCTVDRMVKQFEIVSKYVERIFCFAVPHYLSPYNTVSGYYDSYKYYLKNGVLDRTPPKAPKRFRTVFMTNNGVKCLAVSWSGMYDNLGVHRVNIYKNGEFYTFRASTRNEGGGSPAIYPNSFYDIEYTPDTDETVVYEFEVIDCSGNVSERSRLVVEPGSVPNKVRISAGYSGPIKHAEGAVKGAVEAVKKALGE